MSAERLRFPACLLCYSEPCCADPPGDTLACPHCHLLACPQLALPPAHNVCSTIVASQGQVDPLSVQPPSGNATEMLVSQLAG